MKFDFGQWTFSRIASVLLLLGFITLIAVSPTLQ